MDDKQPIVVDASPEFKRVMNAGEALSCIAYNLSQHAGRPIDESWAALMKDAYEEWDAAGSAYRASKIPATDYSKLYQDTQKGQQ